MFISLIERLKSPRKDQGAEDQVEGNLASESIIFEDDSAKHVTKNFHRRAVKW